MDAGSNTDSLGSETEPVVTTMGTEELIYKSVTVTLNSLSIILALTAFVAALFIHGISNSKSNNRRRLSFRLVMAIAFSDACFSASQIHGLFLVPGFFCTFSTWAFLFFLLLSQFLTSCIALNLFLVLVLEKTLPSYIEYFYFGGSILAAFAITILPVLFGIVGYDSVNDSCWFIDQENINTVIWEMCSLYGWAFLSVILCFSAVAFIVYKLSTRFNTNNLNKRSKRPNIQAKLSTAKLQKKLISRTVGRIALYPLVPSISLLLNLSNLIYILVHKENPFPFAVAGTILYSSHGIVTAVLFLFDPTVSAAITSRKYQLIVNHFPKLAKSSDSNPDPDHMLSENSLSVESRSIRPLSSSSSLTEVQSNFKPFSSIWFTYKFVLTKEQRDSLRNDQLHSGQLGDEYFMERQFDMALETNSGKEQLHDQATTTNVVSRTPSSGSEFVASFNFRRLSNDIAIPTEHMKKFMKSL